MHEMKQGGTTWNKVESNEPWRKESLTLGKFQVKQCGVLWSKYTKSAFETKLNGILQNTDRALLEMKHMESLLQIGK